jgi:AcrR family transcriptional regulator
MPRAGLTSDLVVAAAGDHVDRNGIGSLTLASLAAELGVKSPSLYNHVDGLEDLKRSVALAGVDLLAEACRDATMGRTGKLALAALARAYRQVAVDHPGVYALTQVARPDDDAFTARGERVLRPVYAVLAGYGLEGDAAVHAARVLRSALHGFALLETQSGFGIDLSTEDSFDRLIDVIDAGLSAI